MNPTLKSLTFVLAIFCFHSYIIAESNPHKFIDSQAQEMVSIIRNNQALYAKDPELFKDKINTVFEPMVDFRRVGASVMGKKYYLAASKSQRLQFIQSFKESLLDTYSSTLAQWGDQKIVTLFPELSELKLTEDVQQNLITSSHIIPITYKVRQDKNRNLLIINLIVTRVNLCLTFRHQFPALAKEHTSHIVDILMLSPSDTTLL